MGWNVVADLPALTSLLGDVEVGGYANGFKLIPVFIILVIWARLLTWADKDADEAYLPRLQLNLSFLGGLALALFVFFLIPGGYWVALGAYLFIFAAEVATYLMLRKKKVGLKDLQEDFRAWVKGFGRAPKDVVAVAGSVGLIAKAGGVMAAPADEAPERLGYDAAQKLLTDPLRRGADYIQMAQTEEGAQIKYLVDGMSYDGPTLTKPEATAGITLLKQLAGLSADEKRKPQRGTIKTTFGGKKHELRILTRGSTAGESTAIDVDMKNRHVMLFDDLGLSDSQLKRMSSLTAGGGLVLAATPQGQGLTTLLYALARKHDAFLSLIHTVEHAPDDELEGITQNRLAADASGADEMKLMTWVTSQEPDVLIVDRVDDAATAAELLRFAGTGKRVYVGIRAGSTLDALTAWRKLVGDEKLATKSLELVIAGKLMRKLCTACKMEYSPEPEMLRRMNMSPDKVGSLFQARSQPLRDPKGAEVICEFCAGLHYKGRTGVYEVFNVDDEVRQTVTAGGSINQLKMLFKKQKQRYLQEQAVAKAVAGTTSLQEVARMLKSGEPGGSSSRSSKAKPTSA